MPPAPHSGRYANTRASPRFAFDALVGVVVSQADNPGQFWSRSTDISQGGIGVNLIGSDVNTDEVVSLQIPLPKQNPVALRGGVRYRIGRHCGFEFVDLDEDQRHAVRLACEALARSQTRKTRTS
jgi:c-di-GMP-binding flagellar brake protein YcgR